MKNKKIIYFVLALVIIFIIINILAVVYFSGGSFNKEQLSLGKNDLALQEAYNPIINPSEFTTEITNPYFSMPIGKKMVYEAKTEDGTERIETVIPGWTKEIIGVETLVFWDRVYLDGVLIEDTRDYIAQDKEGNVWYFGENVDNYINGLLTDHHGSWIGGVDGAKPGIWMKANPEVGDEYRQEYYKGEAEDFGRVDDIGVKITTPSGTYTDCVKIFEYTPLESATAYKSHCREAGGNVLEEEDNERVELIEIEMNNEEGKVLPSRYAKEGVVTQGSVSNPDEVDELKKEITENDAKEIALKEVYGRVTDVAIEKKFGKLAYVVEIDDNGIETDVIIDIDTGKVLGVET